MSKTSLVVLMTTALILIGALLSGFMSSAVIIVAGIIAFTIIIFFSYHLEMGMYVLLVLFPMIGLKFDISSYRHLLGPNFGTADLKFPLVDVWAGLLVCSYIVYLIRKWLNGSKHRIYLPNFFWYTLFIFSGIVSLINVKGFELSLSISYIIRFIIFIYIGYVVLGVNIVRDKKILSRALSVCVGMGTIMAVLGLIGFISGIYIRSIHRAAPISLFGWNPFNYDQVSGHILLAEVLVIILPISICLAFMSKTKKEKKVFTLTSMLIGLASFLTFSRAGWLTLIFEGLIILYFFRNLITWDKIKKYVFFGGLLFVPAATYMLIFLQSAVVSASNSTRTVLIEVAWDFFLTHPIVGQGAGTFVDRLGEVRLFTYQFGEPIDAHSIVAKLLAEQGLLGILSFAVFILSLIIPMYHRTKDKTYRADARSFAYLSVILVTAPIFFQLFNTQYYSARMWVPIMLGIAIHLVYRHESSESSFYTYFRPDKYEIDTKIN